MLSARFLASGFSRPAPRNDRLNNLRAELAQSRDKPRRGVTATDVERSSQQLDRTKLRGHLHKATSRTELLVIPDTL